MKKGSSKCYERREHIEKMIEQDLNRQQIAARLEISLPTLDAGLKLLGLSTKRQHSPKPEPNAPAIEPMVGTVYIDGDGLKVTRYPARWADGAFMQVATARSRRK